MYIPWGQHWPSNRAKGHRFHSAIKLNAKFQRAIERRISIQTVRNRLKLEHRRNRLR